MAKTYQPKFLQDDGNEPEGDIKEDARSVKKGSTPERSHMSKYVTADDTNLVDIWERRMLNPTDTGGYSYKIAIKTPAMHLRWINTAQSGRYQRAREHQGYVPVHKDELVDERQIYGVSYTTEGWVCRGERQKEMLMKIPEYVFRKIRENQTKANRKSYEKLKENLASAGAKHFSDKYNTTAGDQAAEAATRFKGNISFGEERITEDEGFSVDAD